MIIKNIKNPIAFFDVLKNTKGEITLTTKQGDQLNLKSKLCQYIVMLGIFDKPEIEEMEIHCTNPDDLNVILEFLVRG